MALSEAVRKQISDSHKGGMSIKSICLRFKCARDTAKRWIREGQKQRPCFKDAHRSGKPSSLTPSERSKARRMARNNRTVPQITGVLSQQRHQPVSSSSVRRALKYSRNPLQWVPVNRGRTLRAANKQTRLAFCKKHKRSQCKAWLFGDCKFYYLFRDGAGKVRWGWHDLEGQQQVLKSGSQTVTHFYGLVGKGYKSPLYFVPPTPLARSKARKRREAFASKHFIAMLHEVKRDLVKAGKFSPRHPIVLDHARQHTSAASKDAISRQQLRLVEDFPAQSWDINIIENVWGVLDGKLSRMCGRQPTTPYGWRRRIQQAWRSIDQATIDKLVDAVPDRMAGVAEQQGSWLFKKG